jgi:hypothetical protein
MSALLADLFVGSKQAFNPLTGISSQICKTGSGGSINAIQIRNTGFDNRFKAILKFIA